MTAVQPFTGFPREALDFLAGLGKDNSKDFFDAHRATYESALLAPAKAFVVAVGKELRGRVSPRIRAEPRVNGSVLRINRDTRFARDKRPYKDHLDMIFWEGEGHSRQSARFFVRLRHGRVGLGAGMHHFERDVLEAYRAAVLDDRAGAALEDAVARATARRGVQLGGASFKRVPRGVPPDHPRATLLLHGGLFAGGEWDLPSVVHERGFVPWVADRLEATAPVERWLTELLATTRAAPVDPADA